jgi:diguanylate cyclase (GGDEF) domain
MAQLFLIFIISIYNSHTKNESLFQLMLSMIFGAFIANIISSIKNGPDWLFPFSAMGNYIEMILSTTIIPLYYNYICQQIYNIDVKIKLRYNILLWSLCIITSVIIISTSFTGMIFYFDDLKQYHRGPFFYVPMLIILAMIIIVESLLLVYKKRIKITYYHSLTLFLLAPILGWILQFFIFGLPFSLVGITFAALILFLNIQYSKMDRDYLTGTYNRQALDNYMQHMIDTASNRKQFAAILIDLDNFKSINDKYGHYEGDIALKQAVKLLYDSVRHSDFIARYGGDEFCIVIDSDDPAALNAVIDRIKSNLTIFNQKSNKPYELSFSLGSSMHDKSFGNKAEQFYKVIDKRMYENKLKNDLH